MNENAKTAVFFGVAAVIALVVWLTAPRPPESVVNAKLNNPLFPDFKDPEAATSIEIIEFDEDSADRRTFEVAKTDVDGKAIWSIPSHDDYPADAQRQLAEAATSLMDLTVLEIASKDPAQHETYGVIDPDPDLLKSGATGVGDRITMKDKNAKTLLSLIVGKKVPERPNPIREEEELHYVRVTGEDPVYVVALDTKKLTTKFNEWIEPDLLKINTLDIKQLWFRDYGVVPERGALEFRGDVTVEYDEAGDPSWKLVKNMVLTPAGQLTDEKMPEGMELNTDRLTKAKGALDDLEIVDVQRKPEGLSADLKADENLSKNREARRALEERGFYVAEYGGRVEVFSDQGEIRCRMKDGVEYVLRFGSIAIGSKPRTDEEEEDEAGALGLNRFLFVTAGFNPDAIPQPQFEIPPEARPKPEGDEAEKSEDEKKKEEAEIERIKTANQRKQDTYDETIKTGKERAKELNARFADWYFIISDDVFQKIHLSPSDIFKKKEEPKEDEAGAHDHGHGLPAPFLPGGHPAVPKPPKDEPKK